MPRTLIEKRLELVLFLVLLFSFAYFYQGGGANQNARLDQIRSIVEYGQLNLKGTAGSHDIVQVGRRTYPNKAPGIVLAGTLPFLAAAWLKGPALLLVEERYLYLFVSYLVTVLTVGAVCAAGGVVFFRLLGLFDGRPAPRLLAVAALFVGTPAFAYSTMLYGHMAGSVWALLSFYLLYKYSCVLPHAPRARFFIFLSGLSGGWAVVTEYPTIVIVAVLSLYCLFRSARLRTGRWWGNAGAFLLGALFPALVLLGYNRAVFGRWLYVAYFDKRAAAHSAYKRGPVLGFSFQLRTFLNVVWQTSFGAYRGFFHLSPFLVLIFPGTWYLARRRGGGGLALAIWFMALAYFALNSVYPYWYGGKALGPRHAMEMLPWLVLLAFFCIRRLPLLSGALVAVSAALMLVAVSVRPEEYVTRPFRDLYFECFQDGALAIRGEPSFVNAGEFNSFNVGQLLGLPGRSSLVPLLAVWFAGGLFMSIVSLRHRADGAASVSSAAVRILGAVVVLLLVLEGVTLYRLMRLEEEVALLTDTGEYRVPPGEIPAAQVREKASPGHRLQVWEVLKPYAPGDLVTVKAEHAAGGDKGGFSIIAFADRNGDGRPDIEISRSPFLAGRRAGDWSQWSFRAPTGKIFVGYTWREGARVYFERTGWKDASFSPEMYYSSGELPTLSTSPRASNLAVEIGAGGAAR
ncbi:MAG TPA: hypothetical protein PLI51_07925 [bacterium]|nr:hypothetical protein [bacterium]HPQ66636.1 hypothetical protein [bacterium]